MRIVCSIILVLLIASTATIANDQAPPPRSGWGAVLGKAELDGWISEASEEAPSLVVAEQATRVETAGGALAKAGRRPDLSLTADVRTGRTQTPMTGGVPEGVETLVGRAQLTWELDLFGKVRSEIGSAQFAEIAASHQQRNRQLVFAADVARTYLAGTLLNDRIKIQTEIETAYAAIVDYTESRVTAGLVRPETLESDQDRRHQAHESLIDIHKSLAALEASWRYLIPEAVAPSLKALGGLSEETLQDVPSEAAIHAYAVNRPDVNAAHALWSRAVSKARVASRDRLPSVSAVALAEGEGPSFDEEPDNWTAWAAARITLPILSPRKRSTANIEQERAALQEALFEETVALAMRDIWQAYADRIYSEKSWKVAKERANHLLARYDSIRRQYDAGIIAQPALEAGKIAWLKADESAKIKRSDTLLKHLALLQACGGPSAAWRN